MKRFAKAIAALMLTTAVLFTAECMNAQTHKGHDYVDLGLPSGTLWATCNVGANAPKNTATTSPGAKPSRRRLTIGVPTSTPMAQGTN